MKISQLVIAAALSLSAIVSAQDAPSLQGAPALRMTLSGPAIVSSNANVTLLLTVEMMRDADVAASILNGMDLSVRVDGKAVSAISQPGKGAAVPMVAGTRIERRLSLPVSAFQVQPDLQEMAVVAVGWTGQLGVDCTFKVAPDSSKVELANLDLAKTQVILVTNYGEMQLSFRPDKAPRHVENFVKLCLQGFYDGTKFHRVIRNFMIQGGCPNTKDDNKKTQWGSGGPGYRIDAEFNDLRHLKGTLSMARTQDPNSAGSGFFIVHKDSAHLDNQYSAFGNLVEGVDVLDAIANVQVGGPQKSTPLQPVVLSAAVVLPVTKK